MSRRAKLNANKAIGINAARPDSDHVMTRRSKRELKVSEPDNDEMPRKRTRSSTGVIEKTTKETPKQPDAKTPKKATPVKRKTQSRIERELIRRAQKDHSEELRKSKTTRKNFKHNEESQDDTSESDNESNRLVEFSDDDDAERMSLSLLSGKSIEMEKYLHLKGLWKQIVNVLPVSEINEYYITLRKMILGRTSSLEDIRNLIPMFPGKVLQKHNELFRLISQLASVYPHNYHDGTRLISKHFVGGINENSAVCLLASLADNGVPPDLFMDRDVVSSLTSAARNHVKDVIEKAVANLGEGSNVILKSNLKLPKID